MPWIRLFCKKCGWEGDKSSNAKKCPRCKDTSLIKPHDLPIGDICPTCKRPLKKSPRICAACGEVIVRGHKFTFSGSRVMHIICDNPTKYHA